MYLALPHASPCCFHCALAYCIWHYLMPHHVVFIVLQHLDLHCSSPRTQATLRLQICINSSRASSLVAFIISSIHFFTFLNLLSYSMEGVATNIGMSYLRLITIDVSMLKFASQVEMEILTVNMNILRSKWIYKDRNCNLLEA